MCWAHRTPACFPRRGVRLGRSREVVPGVLVVGRVPVPSCSTALPVFPNPQRALHRRPGLSWPPLLLFPAQAGLLTRPLCFQTSFPDGATSQHHT